MDFRILYSTVYWRIMNIIQRDFGYRKRRIRKLFLNLLFYINIIIRGLLGFKEEIFVSRILILTGLLPSVLFLFLYLLFYIGKHLEELLIIFSLFSFIFAWTFISLQIKEFRIMGLSINDSVYSCVFFSLTGLQVLLEDIFHIKAKVFNKRFP